MPPSNILAHLAPVDINVTVNEYEYTIPAMSAYSWLQVLLDDPFDPYNVFPALAGERAVKHIEDAQDAGAVSLDEIARVGLEIISIAAGRPWWVTMRLLGTVSATWDRIGGELAKTSADATHQSLAGWLDAVWAITLVYVDPKKKAQFMSQLEKVPKDWEDVIDFDEQEQAFMAAMASART